jgi:hypothetical protein
MRRGGSAPSRMATGKPRHPESPGFRRGLFGTALQEAPGGNPGTPGMNTIPPPMPFGIMRRGGSVTSRMATGKPRHPESPGFRRGLFGTARQEAPGGNPGTPGMNTIPPPHAVWPHAPRRFRAFSHGNREATPPGVPRLPPGAFWDRTHRRLWNNSARAGCEKCRPWKPLAFPPLGQVDKGQEGFVHGQQEAPGGNPGTPGLNPIPPPMRRARARPRPAAA